MDVRAVQNDVARDCVHIPRRAAARSSLDAVPCGVRKLDSFKDQAVDEVEQEPLPGEQSALAQSNFAARGPSIERIDPRHRGAR